MSPRRLLTDAQACMVAFYEEQAAASAAEMASSARHQAAAAVERAASLSLPSANQVTLSKTTHEVCYEVWCSEYGYRDGCAAQQDRPSKQTRLRDRMAPAQQAAAEPGGRDVPAGVAALLGGTGQVRARWP